MMKFFNTVFIFLVIFTSAQANAKNSCEVSFIQQNKAKISADYQKWARLAPVKDVARKFDYSVSVVEKILKHEPKVYAEMAKVFLGQKSKYKVEDMMAVDLFRGMALHPKDYDPTFSDNFSGGNTEAGKSWFSVDSSTAHDYATPSHEDILENKPKGKKTLPVGIRINIQLPRYILQEAMVDSFRNEINVALDRSLFPNESLYISSVLVVIADYQSKAFKEEDLSYEEFLRKYLKHSEHKAQFLF